MSRPFALALGVVLALAQCASAFVCNARIEVAGIPASTYDAVALFDVVSAVAAGSVQHLDVDYFNDTATHAAILAEIENVTGFSAIVLDETCSPCTVCAAADPPSPPPPLPICACKTAWSYTCATAQSGCSEGCSTLPQHSRYCEALTYPCLPDPRLGNLATPVVPVENGTMLFYCSPICEDDPTGVVRRAVASLGNFTAQEACELLVGAGTPCDTDLSPDPDEEFKLSILCPSTCNATSVLCPAPPSPPVPLTPPPSPSGPPSSPWPTSPPPPSAPPSGMDPLLIILLSTLLPLGCMCCCWCCSRFFVIAVDEDDDEGPGAEEEKRVAPPRPPSQQPAATSTTRAARSASGRPRAPRV